MSSTRDDPWRGQFSFGTRRVTTVNVPTIIGVKVAGDGLRLRVAHRPGDSAAKNWGTKLDQLKNLFRAAGVDATNLSVVDDARGNIVLRFDDAPSSFPLAIAPEPPKAVVRDRADAINRYQDAAWTLGPDARGNVLRYPVKKYPHVLVASSTGGGKSAWARTTIEQFRVTGWTCFIGSGKVSDFATMRDLPGVAMVTGGDDVAQVAVMVRRVRVEMERRNTQAAEAKQRGDTAAFAFPPILLLLDEWGAVDVAFRTAYKKSDAFLRDVDLILRVGREARVHVVLLSQTIRKTGDGAVPGAWQENLGLTISLGSPSEITLESDAFTAETKGRAAMIGARLKGKPGRGLTVERESGKVVEFQSFYGWSPGTTSLDPNADSDVRPPTEEVRALWERWEPISASVPWIMPRVGIKATSPAWRTGDLSEVANTPTVALTDEHGAVKPGMEQYDPASDEWLGKQPASTATGLHEDLDFDKPETNAPTANAATMSDAELQEAVRQEAIRRGLLDPDPEPESPGETSQRSKPTPKPETKSATKPKIQGEV
ncbi:FtsK/SpoIIIE domain-containing protein [Segniliparus rotundus]|nr:FtsK/SpoIIIE domain-containing protein [Segniliparus rotundus]